MIPCSSGACKIEADESLYVKRYSRAIPLELEMTSSLWYRFVYCTLIIRSFRKNFLQADGDLTAWNSECLLCSKKAGNSLVRRFLTGLLLFKIGEGGDILYSAMF